MLEFHFDLVWPRKGNGKPFLCTYFIPICFACCLVIILCGFIKPALTIERHEAFEIRNRKLNVGNGLQDFGGTQKN